MEYVSAEWSRVPLSRVALGCELLGGADWGSVNLDDAVAAVREALDSGVTVFDTADVYGLGRSEEVLARALGRELADVVIVTKGGVAWGAGAQGARSKTRRDLSPTHLRAAAHASLRRLGIDQLPLYLAHWPDERYSAEEVVATLTELCDEGLLGAFGLSNFDTVALAQHGLLGSINAIEIEHSLLRPQVDALALARTHGAVSLTYGSLAQGLLTGKYPPGHKFPSNDRRHRLIHFSSQRHSYDSVLTNLQDLAVAYGRSQAEIAVRWALQKGPTDCVIVGARNPRQLADSLASLDEPLWPELMTILDRSAESSG